MGLLDDAIREHLDLKRRRGADPDEVARQENEALGPPQMGQFAPADDDLPDDEPLAPEAADEPGEPLGDAVEERPAAVAASLVDEEEPAAGPFADEEPWLEDPVEEPPARSAVDEPTTEFTPPDVEPPESEDVLEETPEFLQETPEHDRLWFEQRPPRDFDFDR
jgi:hypothetical protein